LKDGETMNKHRDLFKKKPNQYKQLIDAMPLLGFLLVIALLVIGIVVVGCMFQAPISAGHNYGVI